jgi:hypothetical protein
MSHLNQKLAALVPEGVFPGEIAPQTPPRTGLRALG